MKIAELTEKCKLLERYQRHLAEPDRFPIVTTIADCGEPLPLPQNELEKALRKEAYALRAEIVAALRKPDDADCCPFCDNFASEYCPYCQIHNGTGILHFKISL